MIDPVPVHCISITFNKTESAVFIFWMLYFQRKFLSDDHINRSFSLLSYKEKDDKDSIPVPIILKFYMKQKPHTDDNTASAFFLLQSQHSRFFCIQYEVRWPFLLHVILQLIMANILSLLQLPLRFIKI